MSTLLECGYHRLLALGGKFEGPGVFTLVPGLELYGVRLVLHFKVQASETLELGVERMVPFFVEYCGFCEPAHPTERGETSIKSLQAYGMAVAVGCGRHSDVNACMHRHINDGVEHLVDVEISHVEIENIPEEITAQHKDVEIGKVFAVKWFPVKHHIVDGKAVQEPTT